MPTERKLSVLVATFPYGGNGASASTCPPAQRWADKIVYRTAPDDDRVNRVGFKEFNDTPITMTRNDAVKYARDEKYDVLIMVDSDQVPDVGRAGAVPFWDAAFDFLYNHYDKGPVVIGAPYCGPPKHENIFVFRWRNRESNHPNADFALKQYSREEAAIMAGIQPCAALPTGLIMCDMRAFELTDPQQDDWHERVTQPWIERIRRGETTFTEHDVRTMAEQYAAARYENEQSWFYYQYTDKFQTEKGSTEDVTATRDIGLIGLLKLGYNPIHCAWSSWAGHLKSKCVGPPEILTQDDVGGKFKRAALTGAERGVSIMEASSPIADEFDWSQAERFEGLDNVQVPEEGNGERVIGIGSPAK